MFHSFLAQIRVQTESGSVWPDDTPVASAKAGPGNSSGEADEEGNANSGRLWRTVIIGEQEHRIDMQVIKPYLRVITHGGQWKDGPQCENLRKALDEFEVPLGKIENALSEM